jgi:hypothetical protein
VALAQPPGREPAIGALAVDHVAEGLAHGPLAVAWIRVEVVVGQAGQQAMCTPARRGRRGSKGSASGLAGKCRAQAGRQRGARVLEQLVLAIEPIAHVHLVVAPAPRPLEDRVRHPAEFGQRRADRGPRFQQPRIDRQRR